MTEKQNRVTVNRKYKDTIFRMIFHEKKELLSLYNALNDTYYTDEDEIEVVTLENSIYMGIKNDLAFILDCHLYLYEHQASVNPNMPLRDLFYISQEYQKIIAKKSLYSSVPLKIPAPSFVVFYNGKEEQPERLLMKLSDLYELPQEFPMLELQVLMLNINQGKNEALKEKCTVLKEYMQYVELIRYYTDVEEMSLQEAVECSVNECIKQGILEEFLRRNKAEAIMISIFEYDEEEEKRKYREAEREAAREAAMKEAREIAMKEARETVMKEAMEEARETVMKEAMEEAREIVMKEAMEEARETVMKEAREIVVKEKEKIIANIMKNMNLTEEEARRVMELD